MTPLHAALAVLVAAIWGLAFVATEIGLESFSPAQLAALRFIIAAMPVFFVARPAIPLPRLLIIGTFLFTGQFLFLFFGFVQGMPPGLASVTMQVQAFFTILIAALALSETPSAKQTAGIATSFVGLVLIGLTVGGDLTYLGLGLTLCGALSWAVGNVLLKRERDVDMFALVVWLSLVPPLPALAISMLFDDRASLLAAVAGASWHSIGAALYLGLVATAFAYVIWGRLLRNYPTALVAPFALLAPCTGIVSSFLVFGETFGAQRSVGMALILIGLVVTVLSRDTISHWRRAFRRGRT